MEKTAFFSHNLMILSSTVVYGLWLLLPIGFLGSCDRSFIADETSAVQYSMKHLSLCVDESLRVDMYFGLVIAPLLYAVAFKHVRLAVKTFNFLLSVCFLLVGYLLAGEGDHAKWLFYYTLGGLFVLFELERQNILIFRKHEALLRAKRCNELSAEFHIQEMGAAFANIAHDLKTVGNRANSTWSLFTSLQFF